MDASVGRSGNDASQSRTIPAKRPHVSRQTQAYPRKRAMKACNTCRFRKTKCNNERPVCGFCRSLGAVCDYEEGSDVSMLDPASQLIMQKLDEVLQKLHENSQPSSREHGSSSARTERPPQLENATQYLTPHSTATPSNQESRKTVPQSPDNSNVLITPPFRTAPDTILEWPVLKFSHNYDSGFISDALFEEHFLDSNPHPKEDSEPRIARISGRATVDEEAFPRLVSLYLAHIHIKTPIIDATIANEMAVRVSANGLRWDDSSCLTLIMAALGMISSPLYTQPGAFSNLKLMDRKEAIYYSRPYYDAARKRIGLLDSSILSVQCLFLCGTYEMLHWNPLRAYKWFTSASSALLVYLKSKEAHVRRDPTYTLTPDAEREEASIYWSCYKAMCEIRTELPVPPSILAEVDYPHVLPSPPSNFTKTMGFNDQGSTVFGPYDGHLPQIAELDASSESQETWFFYMTDIILSRLEARILQTLYARNPSEWNPSNLHQMLQAVNEFECKLEHWYIALPPSLKFPNTPTSTTSDPNSNTTSSHPNPLAQALNFRSLQIKSILYRPFLYYSLHHSTALSSPSSEITHPQILDFTQKSIQASTDLINFCHHESRNDDRVSWFMGRMVLTSALSVCAVVRSVGVDPRSGLDASEGFNWKELIVKAIEMLEAWHENREAGDEVDLPRGVDILRELIKG